MINPNIENRDEIIDFLSQELVGPAPRGEELDFNTTVILTREQSYKPYVQSGTGEEVLANLNPCRRYGMGVLYPAKQLDEDQDENANIAPETPDLPANFGEQVSSDEDDPDYEIEGSSNQAEDGEQDETVSKANSYFPSTMGISCLVEMQPGDSLSINVSGAVYKETKVVVDGAEYSWWLRQPVEVVFKSEFTELLTPRPHKIVIEKEVNGLDLQVNILSRSISTIPEERLLTITLANRTDTQGNSRDSSSLFQASFDVSVPFGKGLIKPYPKGRYAGVDLEDQSLELLYRHFPTYAIGHGCSPTWDMGTDETSAQKLSVSSLPIYETPSITPNITDNGSELGASMHDLAGLNQTSDGLDILEKILSSYSKWIASIEREMEKSVPAEYQNVAKDNVSQCKKALERMTGGLRYLNHNSTALRAFQLANHAMLLQQIVSSVNTRHYRWDDDLQKIIFNVEFNQPDLSNIPAGRGLWRPFQIAFMLMTLESTADPQSEDRDAVDLIWFPTGGGKTEAYLGLSAFSIFLRRLRNPNDPGTDVLTRYTLRLLTSQQFQRTASLITAMEYLRRGEDDLGFEPIRIGIWVGGDITPNQRQDARDALSRMKKTYTPENPFLLLECPWCKAEMGPKDPKSWGSAGKPVAAESVYGYAPSENTVRLMCPDVLCDFTEGIPVWVIDEDIYDYPPDFLIATVDKFALLSWGENRRGIFGIGSDGSRTNSPPNLIIQDELHLISGPLGSMVGLYEVLIENLCQYDTGSGESIGPKIVSSTATIRRYKQQVKALYARNETYLFPPPGIDVSDSFFASYARDEETNQLLPGRKYVGALAPGLGSMQTLQVRTYSALFESIVDLPPDQQDPWYTLMVFFGSLRELGTTLTLLQTDIRNYQTGMYKRGFIKIPFGEDKPRTRNIFDPAQLTSALKSHEIPQKIRELSTSSDSDQKPPDICLASSIIEVGIDIDRLSLMSVTGQPKTTSQYIQVTGRIGRNWEERPGLVITLYGANRPRDRSHYESFQSYHSKLYSQVEPTSVTPFAAPVLDRALHSLIVGYVRQRDILTKSPTPNPFPADLISQFKEKVLNRVSLVDPDEYENCLKVFTRREKEWEMWGKIDWGSAGYYVGSDSLLYPSGSYVPFAEKNYAWSTPTTLRSVDAQCELDILKPYFLSGVE